MDQLKLFDEKVETRLDSKTSAKNDDMEKPDSSCKLILNGSKKWEIQKSDITGILQFTSILQNYLNPHDFQ